jgi:hypothetical protein
MLFLKRPISIGKAREVERESEHRKPRENEHVGPSPAPQTESVLGRRVWGIKLGTGGIYVDFCEKHNIVGIGWVGVSATGQVLQFVDDCAIGDYIIYYNPPRKEVRICRVLSEAMYRDFDLTGPEANIDIWHYRKVEYPFPPTAILDFHAGLKGRILDPRVSFWELMGAYQTIDQIARSRTPQIAATADSEIMQAYATLRALVVARSEALNEKDWQCLVVDYLKAQAAWVYEKEAAIDQPRINVEARFNHGEFGEELWRVYIIRSNGQKVDRLEIEQDLKVAGNARLCFVAVFGFTEQARQLAHDRGARLMEPADFTAFLLTGKLRESIRQKLRVPCL